MALFQGKDAILEKPYLMMLKKKIENKEKIRVKYEKKFIEVIFLMNKEIKELIKGINSANINKINSILKDNKGKFRHVFETKDKKLFKWTDIDKSPFSGAGGSKKSDAKTTAMQERASMYAIEMGLNNNGYNDKNKFLRECRKKLLELYPDMDSDWEETFFQQQKTVSSKIPNNNNFNYSRDDGFMKDITNFVKKFGISKKDSWNPADIWIVENPKKQMQYLQESLTINSLNEKMRTLFKENKIIGISLKKMSGKKALWEVVNVDMSVFKNKHNYSIGNTRIKFDLINGKLSSTDSIIEIMNGTKLVATIQMRQNSKGFSNLKFEGTSKDATSARLGKVPLDMLDLLCKEYKFNLNNKWQNYPKNAKEFDNEKEKYIKYFNFLKDKVQTNINNEDEFYENVLNVYNSKSDIANSKLMQLEFLYNIYNLKKDDLNNIITEMYFLAQKKGKQFGPFAKLF